MWPLLLATLLSLFFGLSSAGFLEGFDDNLEAHEILHPVHIDDYEFASGYVKRDGETLFDHLVPSQQTHLSYGRPGKTDAMMLANMTLHSPDGALLVTMERFEELTSAVDCHGDDGQLSMTFKSREAFDFALKSWTYINDDENANFILITNHDGCGPQHERQTYRISKVDSQEENLRTVMTATRVKWEDTALNFDLDMGLAALSNKGAKRLRIRGFPDFGALQDPVTNDTASELPLESRALMTKEVGWMQLGAGLPKDQTIIYDFTKHPPRFKIKCAECYFRGRVSLDVTVHVRNGKVDWLNGIAFALKFRKFQLAWVILWELVVEIDKFDGHYIDFWKLLKITDADGLSRKRIPFLSPGVPHVFGVATSWSWYMHPEIQYFGRLSFKEGWKAELPSPTFRLNFLNPDGCRMEGLDTFKLTKTPFSITDASALTTSNFETNMMAFPGIQFNFGVEVLTRRLEAQVQWRAPNFNINGTAGYEPKGYCKAGAKKYGYKAMRGTNYQVWLKVPMKSASTVDMEKVYDMKKVWAWIKRGGGPPNAPPGVQVAVRDVNMPYGESTGEDFDGHETNSTATQEVEHRDGGLAARGKVGDKVGNEIENWAVPKNWFQEKIYNGPPRERIVYKCSEFAGPRLRKPPKVQPAKSKPKKKPAPTKQRPTTAVKPVRPTVKPPVPLAEFAGKGCKVAAERVYYRACPDSKKCDGSHTYKRNQLVRFQCWVKGEVVRNNSKWGKDVQGRYVTLAWIESKCASKIPQCKVEKNPPKTGVDGVEKPDPKVPTGVDESRSPA